MRVLLIGSGDFYHIGAFFRNALMDLGHQVSFVDENSFLKSLQCSKVHKIAYRLLGRRPLTYWALNRQIILLARKFQPEIILVTKGAYISPNTLATVRQETDAFLVNYATDDPFNPANRTADLVAGIPLYDLYVCTKRAIMKDIRHAGCREVAYVRFGYEPRLHFPERSTEEGNLSKYTSDLVFVGTGVADRFALFGRLAHFQDLRFQLYGRYWDRDPVLAAYCQGVAIGREYRLVLGSTKIGLCLLRHANRDTHTMRTFEIPACGAFMLAERTDEHLALFTEEQEAAFFESEDELHVKVKYYLQHDTERRRIAEAGYRSVTGGKHTYRDRVEELLRLATKIIS